MKLAEPELERRLLDGGDETAALLQRALGEPLLGPTEEQSWRRLQERTSGAPLRWLAPALAFAAAACAVALWLGRSGSELLATPDTWQQQRPGAPALEASTRPSAPLTAPAPSTTATPLKVAEPRSSSAEGEGAAAQCSELAHAGKYEQASACYARIARGSSMAAELALYEKARLEAKALGRSEQALATLSEHARRFPGGLLSSEVGLTRIELLSRLGRRAEALSAIDQALPGSLGRERGSDLQVLRADLLAADGDCTRALDAAASARAAGAHPSRLEAAERRCATPKSESPAPSQATSPSPTPSSHAVTP